MDEDERVELEADIEKIHHTLEADKSQWQFDDYDDSDEDSDEEDDILCIDLETQPSASVSVASLSARSGGGRTTPSAQSLGSRQTVESETADQDEDAENLFREVGVVIDQATVTPDLPASISSCLALNHAYQDLIAEHISRIELALAENREAQRVLQEETTESSKQLPTKKRFLYSMAPPYFRQGQSSCPRTNEDVIQKQVTKEPDLDMRPDMPWNQRMRGLLKDAVKDDALKKLLQPLLSRRELEEEKLQNVEENSKQWNSIRKKIADIEKEIEKKQDTSEEQLLRDVDVERVDWMKISNLTFNGKRDWKSCKRAWVHLVDPKINHEPLQPAEEKRLQKLARETNGSNWVYIAQQLGTGRTAFQCLQYYQQNLNRQMLHRPWTEKEDKRLLKVVEKCQQCHFNWHRVSQYMDGRSHTQCYKRFCKIDPNKNTGHWTETEDAQLIAAVKLLGTNNWVKIQDLVPSRSKEQCRERYINSLDPNLSRHAWTYEEDKKLLMLEQKYGKGNWVKMCKEMPGRTDNQLLHRFRRLEDWAQKTKWFQTQPQLTKDLLLGKNMPADKKSAAYRANWEQFFKVFAVLEEDYAKQEADREKGDFVVPRPPFLLGLASKGAQRVWERRMQLHRLVETHMEKLREKLQDCGSETSALQDAVMSLSQDVASARELEQLQREGVAELLPRQPTSVYVRDLLAVSRGLAPPTMQATKTRSEPSMKKEKVPRKEIDRVNFRKSCALRTELRRVMRTNLREPLIKPGRPRKFFWRQSKEQTLSPKELEPIRANALNLYLKSLGANASLLLAEGRKSFPELAPRYEAEAAAAASAMTDEEDDEESDESDEEDKLQLEEMGGSQTVRRSKRARKSKVFEELTQPEPILTECEDPEMKKKLKDYEMLEWMCRVLRIPAAHTTSAQGNTNARTNRVQAGERRDEDGGSHDSVGAGENLQSAAPRDAETQLAVLHSLEGAETRMGNEVMQAIQVGGAASTQDIPAACTEKTSPLLNSTLSYSLPPLPPTSTTLQSFKLLLLKRNDLIQRAGYFYDLSHYKTRKDAQLAQLIRSGKHLEVLNKRSDDLSKVMSKISQETAHSRPGRKRKLSGLSANENIALEMENPRIVQNLRKTDAYRLLQARFQAAFLWPVILSAIYPPFQRRDFTVKAELGERQGAFADPEVVETTWKHMRNRPAMLKSKQFYKFSTKTKMQKKTIMSRRHKKSILKQVKALMVDENDPNPVVTMDTDSDDQVTESDSISISTTTPSTNQQCGADSGGLNPSNSAAESGSETTAQKAKRLKKSPSLNQVQPVRKSQRCIQRVTYEDRLNKKRSKDKSQRAMTRDMNTEPAEKQQRIRRSRYFRHFLIDAMVRMKKQQETEASRNDWAMNRYESDSDDNFPSEDGQSLSWLADLPAAQKDSIIQLEKATAVIEQTSAALTSNQVDLVMNTAGPVSKLMSQNSGTADPKVKDMAIDP